MRLLVAFDGSEGSRAALREAGVLAAETGASVVLLRVVNPLLDAADVVAPTTEAAMTVVVQRERAALAAVLAASGLDPARTETEVVECGRNEDVAEAIERVAVRQNATMIVISSRRAVGMVGMVLGSVTQHVLRHAPCPVLVVRD